METMLWRTAELRELPDGDKGQLVIAFGKTGTPDDMGDIFMPGSYQPTRGGKVFMAGWNHDRKAPVGIGSIEEIGDEAIWSGNMLDTECAAETWAGIKAMGRDCQFSYAFLPRKYKILPDDWSYEYEEIEVFEVSPVLRAATPSSHLVGLKAYGDWRVEQRKAAQAAAAQCCPDDDGVEEEQDKLVFAAFTYKKLITVKDDRVDPICDEAAARGAIPWDEPFYEDNQSPPLHKNCRCEVAYEYKFARKDGQVESLWLTPAALRSALVGAADEAEPAAADDGPTQDDLARAYMTGLLAGGR